MTDRELLELAAKAAGLPLSSEWDSAAHGILIGHGDGDLQLWNPLFHDGDAFRLAVKLRIDLHFEDQPTWIGELVEAYGPPNDLGGRHCETHALKLDPCAATRRAIVRAAAEIGRQERDK